MLSEDPVNNSNMLNTSSYNRKKTILNGFEKIKEDKIIKLEDGGLSFLDEIDENLNPVKKS